MAKPEYSASQVREFLIDLFPHRKLVLSQLTFFSRTGIAQPTGETLKRGRRCFCLEDILPVACILALKEKGIPLCNVRPVPALLMTHSQRIFAFDGQARLSGCGDKVFLSFDNDEGMCPVMSSFLSGNEDMSLFWSYDVSALARELLEIAWEYQESLQRTAA